MKYLSFPFSLCFLLTQACHLFNILTNNQQIQLTSTFRQPNIYSNDSFNQDLNHFDVGCLDPGGYSPIPSSYELRDTLNTHCDLWDMVDFDPNKVDQNTSLITRVDKEDD